MHLEITPPPVSVKDGLALLQELAASELLRDIKEVFAPSLSKAETEFLRRAALIAEATLHSSLDPKALAENLRHGRWEDACKIFAKLAPSVPLEEVLPALLGILCVPACYVDLFALAALSGVADVSTDPPYPIANPGSIPTRSAIDFAARHRTGAGLQKLCSYGVMKWHDNPHAFELGFDNREVRDRFQRYVKTLTFLSQKPQAYAEVMTLVQNEDWRKGEERAAAILASAGIPAGPPGAPALADFLIAALTPFRSTPELAQLLISSA